MEEWTPAHLAPVNVAPRKKSLLIARTPRGSRSSTYDHALVSTTKGRFCGTEGWVCDMLDWLRVSFAPPRRSGRRFAGGPPGQRLDRL